MSKRLQLRVLAVALFLGVLIPGTASPVALVPTLLELLPANWTDDNGQKLSLPALRGRRIVMTVAYSARRNTRIPQ